MKKYGYVHGTGNVSLDFSLERLLAFLLLLGDDVRITVTPKAHSSLKPSTLEVNGMVQSLPLAANAPHLALFETWVAGVLHTHTFARNANVWGTLVNPAAMLSGYGSNLRSSKQVPNISMTKLRAPYLSRLRVSLSYWAVTGAGQK